MENRRLHARATANPPAASLWAMFRKDAFQSTIVRPTCAADRSDFGGWLAARGLVSSTPVIARLFFE